MRLIENIRDIFVDIKIRSYDRKLRENERTVGIRPSFGYYGPFMPGFETSNMSEKWQVKDVPVNGNNYWALGGPSYNGSSSRFDPQSELYQAWFGIYTHTGLDGGSFGFVKGEPDINVLKRLAEIDQEFWLKAYGDETPLAKLHVFDKKGKINVDGNDAWLYYGEIDSHSDVGIKGRGYEGLYPEIRRKRFVSGTAIKDRFFVPDPVLWESSVKPHHRINLKGLFAVVPVENATACIYLNGAEYETGDGKHHDTWHFLKKDALDVIQSVSIKNQ